MNKKKKFISFVFLFAFVFPMALDCCLFADCGSTEEFHCEANEISREKSGSCCEPVTDNSNTGPQNVCYCDSDIQLFVSKQNELNSYNTFKSNTFFEQISIKIIESKTVQNDFVHSSSSGNPKSGINVLFCSLLI